MATGRKRHFASFVLALLVLLAGWSVAGAMAPKTKFQQAKDRAVAAYKTLQLKYFDSSILADDSVQKAYADAKGAWDRALENAVELDPSVVASRRKLAAIDRKPEDKQDPYERPAAVEGLQQVRQLVETQISREASDAFDRFLEASQEDVARPALPYSAEMLAYGGGVFTTSFGQNFDAGLFGGRAAAGWRLSPQWRIQLDIEGEATSSYCAPCGSRAHVITGGHIDWSVTRRFAVGAFGGVQHLSPTYSAPDSTNAFGGVEARYLGRNWMTGVQAGYFDAVDGPGTLTNAWFVEGRANVVVGRALNIPALWNLTLGVSAGHASGKLSTSPLWADSTQFSVMLSQRITGTPVTAFAGFHHYTNRVETRGTVWDENMVKAGVKIDLFRGSWLTDDTEDNWPFARILRTNVAF